MHTTTETKLSSSKLSPNAKYPREFRYICVPADSESFGLAESPCQNNHKLLEIPPCAEVVKLEGDEQPEMQYPELLLVRLADGTELIRWNIVGRAGTPLERVSHKDASLIYAQQREAFLNRFPLRANRGGLPASRASKEVA